MYKLTAADDGVLYAGFLRHFDDMWRQSLASASQPVISRRSDRESMPAVVSPAQRLRQDLTTCARAFRYP